MNNIPFDHYQEIIPDFSSFVESLHSPIPVHIRVNRLKIEPESLIAMFRSKGIQLDSASPGHEGLYLARGLNSPGGLFEYFMGYFHPQALTSCLAPIVLNPRHGSLVLDMCAAPGGKTGQMAEIMSNTGLIIANELYPSRHVALGHTLARLGVLNTIVTSYQAQEFPKKKGAFDYILADVPCSGEGRFRVTFPGARYLIKKKKRRLPEIQKRIILRGFDLLKEGGHMLYATCTYNPEENEGIVQFLLENREEAMLLPIDVDIKHEPGLMQWGRERYDREMEKAVRFYPHQVNSVGFFMARITRRR
ncbi:MAG: RsmB/NOP family class I SAM-dependent RNA methyltransferase [Deltaproteobacteria bacterium]|nr:RsmB/NOP family class I SAM-dependent RNA methyltransferase [Deltaproteobacteria bacterium]